MWSGGRLRRNIGNGTGVQRLLAEWKYASSSVLLQPNLPRNFPGEGIHGTLNGNQEGYSILWLRSMMATHKQEGLKTILGSPTKHNGMTHSSFIAATFFRPRPAHTKQNRPASREVVEHITLAAERICLCLPILPNHTKPHPTSSSSTFVHTLHSVLFLCTMPSS